MSSSGGGGARLGVVLRGSYAVARQSEDRRRVRAPAAGRRRLALRTETDSASKSTRWPVDQAAPRTASSLWAGDFGDAWTLTAGYRTVEGGADVDEVYTFAWLHYAELGIERRF